MKRVLLLTATALLFIGNAWGVPAKSQLIKHTQPDGSVIEVRLCGDEFHHYYMTQDGDYVTLDSDGYFKYTTLDAQNNPVASCERATLKGNKAVSQSGIAMRNQELRAQNKKLRSTTFANSQRTPMHKVAQKSGESTDTRGLIILVNFTDKSFVTPYETIYDMMNKEGFTDNYGSIGSARDYFIAQSYGAFRPMFDIVGPITLSRNMSYYGSNDRYGSDMRPHVMVSEACELASEMGLVDMSDYDLDNDGWVDLVYVIYAGNAESSGAPASTVWPHAWNIYQGANLEVTVDGVRLDAYACSSELYDLSADVYDGIGTFCHEYSHTLGLPDMYDIDNSGAMGMHYWSVMSAGNYCVEGYVPLGYSAYERTFCGWLELNELEEAAKVVMPDLKDDKTAAYRISSHNENQYIILETRNQRGWDIGLDAEGMMVTAIDYDRQVWDQNGPNDDPSRQRIKLIPADNKWNTNSTHGDLYPYNGNDKLTSTSTPAMKVYNTLIEDKPITDITYEDGIITFSFKGGSNVATPVATSAGNVTASGFTAYWSPVADATSYTLYVERVDESAGGLYFEENFDLFTANKDADISSNIDLFTHEPGWSSTKLFCNDGEAKMGSSKAAGYITTPVLEGTGNITIQFDAKLYKAGVNDGTIYVYITDNNYKETGFNFKESDLSADRFTTLTTTIACDCEYFTFTIEGDNRIYIDNLIVKNEGAGPGGAQEVESCIIDGITNTYYNVDKVVNPITTGTYRYKVRAVKGNETSGWSNVITVAATDETSVKDCTADEASIYAANGVIFIQATTGEKAYIYNLQGHIVAVVDTHEGATSHRPAMSGLYLVRCGNNTTKVVIE